MEYIFINFRKQSTTNAELMNKETEQDFLSPSHPLGPFSPSFHFPPSASLSAFRIILEPPFIIRSSLLPSSTFPPLPILSYLAMWRLTWFRWLDPAVQPAFKNTSLLARTSQTPVSWDDRTPYGSLKSWRYACMKFLIRPEISAVSSCWASGSRRAHPLKRTKFSTRLWIRPRP